MQRDFLGMDKGEMAERVRRHDWSATPLGPAAAWPQPLTTIVAALLAAPMPSVLLWGRDGVMLYNDGYARFAGSRHPGSLGSKVRESWPEIAAFNDAVLRRGLAGESFSYKDQALVLDRHGHPEPVYLDLYYSPVPDAEGRPGGVMAVVVETTARVAAEQRLQRSEARGRETTERLQLALAAGAIVGTWIWNLRTDRFSIDEGFARAFGLDPGLGLDGLSLDQVIATVHPDDSAGLAAAIDDAIARGGPYAHQYRVRRADGQYYWIEANGRVDHGPDGTPSSFPGVLIDLEERRALIEERDRAFAMLRALNETLEQKVAERTTELMQAEDALRQSQKMEAVGQLTGGVAHDFNNLLTIIRSSIDLLRRPDLAAERRTRYLDAVSDTVDRAATLTAQLLAFARRQALKPETWDVGSRLAGLTAMLDPLTGARVTLRLELPEAPCFVHADAGQFETALVNMAVNARDAMNGSGTITVRLEAGRRLPPIRHHAGAGGPFVAVSLTDTGTGIAPESLASIFEPFFTTKPVGQGTGLGLSQVFGFAKQSGGDVDVESVVGQGTTFTLYLPEVATPEKADPPSPADPHASGQDHRVLVVEDNLDVGRFATQILEDLGYRAAWTTNAEEALDRLGSDGGGFDVVFSDVVMPGMGGVALARVLQRRLPDLPIVLASGYSHVLAEDAEHGFTLLHKPYSAEQLSRVLRSAIARAAAK